VTRGSLSLPRALFPAAWLLAAAGYFGPWIAHKTAALTLSGIDMGEFVKFLPQAQSLGGPLLREAFYTPPVAVVAIIALVARHHRLGYSRLLHLAFVLFAVPVSLQLLPPAWSPASLTSPEFRLQLAALLACWGLLLASWLLPRLPSWLTGSVAIGLALGALSLSSWQLFLVRPSIGTVYGARAAIGWGYPVSAAGLALMVVASLLMTLRDRE
jgi:hypothetical protein